MPKSKHLLDKVISGGQTGADQAGLMVAKRFGIKTGGWAPKNWMTSKGPDRALQLFDLKEHKGGYKQRTWANVEESDGTIRLAVNFNSPGERCTANAILHFGKPKFDVDLYNPSDVEQARRWIVRNKIKVLNIAGNSEKRGTDQIFVATASFLIKLFRALGHKEVV